MAKTYRMVRLTEETHARLLAYVASVEQASGERGPWQYDERGEASPVLDSVIGELLDRVTAHRFRAKCQRERVKVANARKRRANRFDKAWLNCYERGECDAVSGAECGRVWMEWHRAGEPEDIEGFIRQASNRTA